MCADKSRKDDVSELAEELFGTQTRLAVENFTISGKPLPACFIHALGLIKACAAEVNGELGLLPRDIAAAINWAALEVAAGRYDKQFPVDVFQTGSATSTNMNANEVIATLAGRQLGFAVHPNDHVNRSQSSNDVIPTAIHVSAAVQLQSLQNVLQTLELSLLKRATEFQDTVKTGRTHLMDAVPVTLGQELEGWAAQIKACIRRLEDVHKRLLLVAQGGTAVGTGLNSPPEFAIRFTRVLRRHTGIEFHPVSNHFAAIGAQDTALELSGQLKVVANALLKIATDLRWMNSGPVAGLAEIRLPELQHGSSIMPGKVNPVIPEAVSMACVQVIGLDSAVTIAVQDNRFQLATMLPLIANNLIEQLTLLTGATQSLDQKAVQLFKVNHDRLDQLSERNAMLVTVLNSKVGYDKAAQIAKTALQEDRPLIQVALEQTDLTESVLQRLLDPMRLAKPHKET